MKLKNIHGAPLLLTIISVLLLAVQFADVSFLSVDGNAYLTVAVLEVIVFAIPSIFYARLRGKKYLSHMRLTFVKAVDIPIMIYALGFMIFGGATLNYYLYKLIPGLYAASSTGAVTAGGLDSGFGTGLYAVISVAVLPAVTEEFLFRGIVLTEYERNGVLPAVILSSFTFSLIHFSFARLPVYFFYGVILALALYATRSLFATVIIHMANNVLVMLLEKYIYRAALRQGGGSVLFIFICTAAALVFAVLFFASSQRSYEDMAYRNLPSDYTKKKKLSSGAYFLDALKSPFLYILLAVSIAGMIANLR